MKISLLTLGKAKIFVKAQILKTMIFNAVAAIFIYVGLFLSCKEQKSDDIQHKVIPIDSEIKICSDSVYFKSTRLIRLETTDNSLIRAIDKIMIDENKIFIFDQSLNGIFIFDKDGKFLYSIKKVGVGPGEYTQLLNVCLDAKNKQLILFPDSPRKIYYMDYSGKLLRETKVFSYYRDVICYENDIYAISLLPSEENNFCCINIVDKNSGKENYLFNNNKAVQNTVFTSGSYLTRTKSINFTVKYENFIYEINNKKVRKKYEIDFGKYNLPNKYKQKEVSSKELFNACNEHGYIFGIVEVVDCDNYLAFRTNMPEIYIYSKEEDLLKKITTIGGGNKYGLHYSRMLSIENTDNSVAFLVQPELLLPLKDYEDKSWINKNLLQLVEMLDSDENPMLMICEFR
ncbi:MAG: 6-bladed beta-propeller [Prevotellaceae bacterium]|jgi:hypothetical protein|nr:6-bladed beta-propeller [Prevotellaceae bacterium]